MTPGPIVIVDADCISVKFYADVINAIGVSNELRFFDSGPKALEYLNSTDEKPFLILSETVLPGMDGIGFKEAIQNNKYLQQKAIPFVFISTDTKAETVRKAQQLNVQGYFEKPRELVYMEQIMIRIFDYWEMCKHINNTHPHHL